MKHLSLLTILTAGVLSGSPAAAVTISNIADQCVVEDHTLGPVAFTVTGTTLFHVVPLSLNTTLIPTANIAIGGTPPNMTVTITPATGQTGQGQITLSVFDLFSGGLTSTGFGVTVLPDDPVTIQCPAPINATADPGSCATVVQFAATAQGGGCTPPTVVCTPPSGSSFTVGTTTVNCIATAPGSTATCSFPVMVADMEPPALTCSNLTACTDPGSCSATVTVTPVASDNCGLVGQITCSFTSNFFPVGTTVVTCSQGDLAGNIGTCFFTVTVNDCEPPTVTCPGDISVTLASGQVSVPVTYAAVASDNCSLANQECTPPSGTAFTAGTAVVTCAATDAAGLTAQCSFSVMVNAAQAPASNKCPLGKGDWKNHPAGWSVTSVSLGGQTYAQPALMALLKAPVKGDASLILASELIAAKLNLANGSDPNVAASLIAQADALLQGTTPLPYGVRPSTTAGQQMVTVANGLDAFNSGSLTPNCVP
jgi:hypothetical protein